MWRCKQHNWNCKSYVQADAKELNNNEVSPETLKAWYKKKYPHMDADDYIKYVNKVLEWVGV